MTSKGTLFIISAPSGAGKTTLVRKLTDSLSGISVSVSYTTRSQRAEEKTRRAYFFVDNKTFHKMKEEGAFLEDAEVFGHYYGTPKAWVEQQLNEGTDVILEIDWQGAAIVKQQLDGVVSIFILPPSKSALKERLLARRQDDVSVIQSRMAQAESEMSHYGQYDYLIINDELSKAYAELRAVILATRLQTSKQALRNQALLQELIQLSDNAT